MKTQHLHVDITNIVPTQNFDILKLAHAMCSNSLMIPPSLATFKVPY